MSRLLLRMHFFLLCRRAAAAVYNDDDDRIEVVPAGTRQTTCVELTPPSTSEMVYKK